MSRRVLLLCGYYYPDSVGGTEKYVHLLARDLRAQGVEVCIAAPAEDAREGEYEHDGIAVYRYPIEARPERAEVRGEVPPRYLERFGRWLERLAPDLVHMHSYSRGCGYWHAREVKARGIPLVVTVHVPNVTCARGTMLRWGSEPCDGAMVARRCSACVLHARGLPKIAAWPLAYMPRPVAGQHSRTRELFDMADSVVAVAEWLADVLRSNGCDPAKLLVSRHGLDDEDLLALRTTRPSARSDRPLELGYVGRLDSTKGVDRVVRAMRLIDRSQPIKLSIYGAARNDEQRAYALKVRDLARGDERISFPGELTPANRARVFGSFDALVVPSVWFETGPLVVLEAFSAGIPVIGSARGGIAELVTDGVSGLLVDDLSAAGWAGAFRAAQARFARGQWQWRFPGTRSSQAVGAEMRRVYDSLWAEDLSRAA